MDTTRDQIVVHTQIRARLLCQQARVGSERLFNGWRMEEREIHASLTTQKACMRDSVGVCVCVGVFVPPTINHLTIEVAVFLLSGQ